MATSILTLWQQYNHINKLIERRRSTLINIQLLSPEETKKALKEEFKDEYPAFWVDRIAKPLAEEMRKLGGFESVLVSGPIGICARVSLDFFDTKETDSAKPVKTIFLEPNLDVDRINNEESILSKRDYNHRVENHPKGSVADSNGMNYRLVNLENDFTAEDLLEYLD